MGFVNANTIVGHPLSGSGKMVPAVRSSTQRPYAEAPAPIVSQSYHLNGARPSSVYVQDNKGQHVLFAFGPGIEGGPDGGWLDFGNFNSKTGSQGLEISPVAWKLGGGSAAAGDVIFIYKGEF